MFSGTNTSALCRDGFMCGIWECENWKLLENVLQSVIFEIHFNSKKFNVEKI